VIVPKTLVTNVFFLFYFTFLRKEKGLEKMYKKFSIRLTVKRKRRKKVTDKQ
jgi:hypothetical protein